ncbi:MAG: guanylate cyclase [Ignavibacteriales bacterium]|nr:MAG: guanylate cyclase [Ignavibacteriales bacterium]
MLHTKIRMLAAIMFTDMVGYTAMMQENEQRAKLLRDKQKAVLEEKIFVHKGQILQYYGDGTLSIFGSVIEAALCAVEIQNELQKDPVVPLRIGIHVGDVVYDDDGVYGDAVNVASRIENLGAAGSVLVSEKVYDEIKNQENLNAVSLGSYELKNVKKPLELFALSSEGLIIPSLEDVKKKSGSNEFSVAVLPFVNMSADPENEYFSDGITEEILNALAQVDGLLVTSRTSSFAFKGKNEDIRQIGNQLGVNTVLEGSVRKIGNRVRITAQLINTKDGYHKWSEIYDRKLEDIFAVQDEISRTIAQQLSQKLSYTDAKEPLVKPKTYNLEAYNLFLKGRYYWNKWTPEDFKKAIECNEESLKIDPEFVYACVGLSSTYLILGSFGYVEPKPALEKAKTYAEKALNLDDTISESHFCYALVQLFYEWNWEKAYTSFQKALEINPGSADVHYTYALYLIAMGRLREALTEVEKAITLDPLSLPINMQLGSTYYYSRRFDDAIIQYKKTLELDENFRSAMYGMGWTYLAMGETKKAIEIILKAQKQAGSDLKGVSALGYAYAKAGELDKAEECIKKLERRKELDMQVSLNMDLAIVYAGLNNHDMVFHHLDLAYEDRSGGMIFLNTNPEWVSKYKSDPRFQELIKKIGIV